MAIPGIMVEEFQVPPIADKLKNKSGVEGYSVKYFKADADDLEQMMMLQEIETRGLLGDEIVITQRDKYSFLAQYFIVIQYLEKKSE